MHEPRAAVRLVGGLALERHVLIPERLEAGNGSLVPIHLDLALLRHGTGGLFICRCSGLAVKYPVLGTHTRVLNGPEVRLEVVRMRLLDLQALHSFDQGLKGCLIALVNLYAADDLVGSRGLVHSLVG